MSSPLDDLERLLAGAATRAQGIEALASLPEIQARVLDRSLLRPGHDCIVMTETSNGLRFFFSLRDTFVGIPIAVGVFERDLELPLNHLLRPGMNCVDIGANLGYYSMRMAAVAGQGPGRVFSFEPDSFACHLLRMNCRENRFENVVTVTQAACGDSNGEALLFRDAEPGNYGGSWVGAGADATAATRIPVRKLDDLIPQDTVIHLVKMDVEGYEARVLDGMRRILETHHPVVIAEYNPPALRRVSQEEPERMLALLRSLGYRIQEAERFTGEASGADAEIEGDRLRNLVALPASQ